MRGERSERWVIWWVGQGGRLVVEVCVFFYSSRSPRKWDKADSEDRGSRDDVLL